MGDQEDGRNSQIFGEPTTDSKKLERLRAQARLKAAQAVPRLGICYGCGRRASQRHHTEGAVNAGVVIMLCDRCHKMAHNQGEVGEASWAWRNRMP